MGLDMHTKRKITAVTAKRYRTADRQGRLFQRTISAVLRPGGIGLCTCHVQGV